MIAPETRPLRRLGETCLWLLVIGATVLAAVEVAALLRLVVLPVLLAVLLTTFLAPPVTWLARRGWPRAAASLFVLLVVLALVAGVFVLIAPPVVDEFSGLDLELSGAVERTEDWLRESPLPVSGDDLSSLVDDLEMRLRESVGAIARQAVGGALVVLEVVTGLALALVVTFFLLKDGRSIWRWLVELLPERHRPDVEAGGERVWSALAGFVRGQTIVALFDAVLIGLALVILGVPLALPLAVLTFFGAYVPVLGATIAGLLAVVVALTSDGVLAAALVLAAIIAVQQIEGNVLQPIVVGRATHVHPIAVLLGVTAGAVLAGIIGAMIAAPLVAVAGAVLASVREHGDAVPGP